MRNIKITIEYDGSRYQGWTRLGKDESNNTISAKIIDVLGKMTGEKNIELNCGCRTEVGVHAYAQVANFKTSSNLSTKDIQHYLNRYLPMDTAILSSTARSGNSSLASSCADHTEAPASDTMAYCTSRLFS